jgi:uncharacterized membrane protein (UPF0127 family)
MRSKKETSLIRSKGRTVPRFVRWVRYRCLGLPGGPEHGEETDHSCGGPAADGTSVAVFEAVNVTKDCALASRVEWAGTSDSRRRGLLGREHIDRQEGAYIVPTQWIHMFGMQFPIDVAFLDSKGHVLHICHALQPNHLSPIVWRAEGALELAAGTLQATGTEVGDIVEIR